MKDYYSILGVTEAAEEQEIRRRYRKLAMQYHPDRNPDDPEAEEKFKEIAEAYGVLTDPVKRQAYDRARKTGAWQTNGSGPGFGYSQEDILKDLFRDPRFQQVFQGLLREFQQAGFRAGPGFISKSFFGGRGGLLLGGLFMVGSLVGPALIRSAGKRLPEKNKLFHSLGTTVGRLIQSVKKPKQQRPTPPAAEADLDVTYVTPLSAQELRDGKTIQVVADGGHGQELLRVAIPPASRAGQKLRVRGRGRRGDAGRGDLYLHLEERDG